MELIPSPTTRFHRAMVGSRCQRASRHGERQARTKARFPTGIARNHVALVSVRFPYGDFCRVREIRKSGLIWRRERDSNPRRAFDPYTLSRGAPSTTRPSLRLGARPARRAGLGCRNDPRRGTRSGAASGAAIILASVARGKTRRADAAPVRPRVLNVRPVTGSPRVAILSRDAGRTRAARRTRAPRSGSIPLRALPCARLAARA